MTDARNTLDDLCINSLRMLAADAVQQANSGHPGMPLGAAAMAYVLWTRFLKHNPRNPLWPNRDRYVHSAGHGSALLYALLHMTGYDLSLDEIKRFRQWESKTPGHPEYDPSIGVESTTGPLGQGFGMGVGMALAERFIAGQCNRPGFAVMDHYTYGIVSDGDLMEGISSEAASLAGHLGLGKLIYLYDDNHISIEGATSLAFTENVEARFEAFGWHVQRVSDGNDIEAIAAAITRAQQETDRPSLIMARTHIGFGSPKQDSEKAHGEPLGEEGLKATKEFFNWPLEPKFYVPAEAKASMGQAVDLGVKREAEWRSLVEGYAKEYPADAQDFERRFRKELPKDWASDIPVFKPEDGAMATRSASGKVLNAIAKHVPELMGGSADLAPSTNTIIAGSPAQAKDAGEGRNIHFGVREHAMGTIVNGMALHRGVIPYGATFLIFSDYVRPAVRLASLMNVHSLFIFTHDSIGLGEDGPTHQPVEHVMSLRAIPRLAVMRPADANETAFAWRAAMERTGPIALVLTRQKLPIADRGKCASAEGVLKGAYVLSDVEGKPDLLIVATGSEVSLALQVQEKLAATEGIRARVVSMPCWELFMEQSQEYRDQVLPPDITARISIEAGCSIGWERWVGTKGDIVSVDRFGASAPGSEVMKHYGFSVEAVTARAIKLVRG